MITALWKPGRSLAQKTIRSGLWVVISQITNRGFVLLRTIILVRLLVPEDFGLIGITTITTELFSVFSRIGFSQALIQKKEDIRDYLNTAWTVSIIRGIILFSILFFSAPLVAQFFNNTKATQVIRLMSLSFIINAVSNVGIIYFTKELDLRKNVLLQFGNTATSLVVSIPLAFVLRNVWAIVFGFLAGSLMWVILSYIIHPYRPKLSFNKTQAMELFSFGKYIFASSILVFMITQGDDAFVGKVLGTISLGFYTIAYRFSNIPATQITHVMSKVTFPAYSKLQENLPKLRAVFLKVLQLTAFFSIPIAGGIFILAPDFVEIFLGEKWISAVAAMQVLAFWGIIRTLVGSLSPIFLAIGRPDILTKCQFGQVVFLFILMVPLTLNMDIFGTSLSVFISAFIMMIIRNYIFIKTIKCSHWSFYRLIFYPLIFTIICAAVLVVIKNYWIDTGSIIGFILHVIIFIISYLSLSIFFGRYLKYNPYLILKEIIRQGIN